MYQYVKDKDYLKRAYSVCADMVNQLVQELKKESITADMNVVGSASRNMVTQNENEPIDFDFNLCIRNSGNISINDGRSIKETIRKAFNRVLNKNGWGDCQDSTSALTTEQRVFDKGNKTPFSIDVCIIHVNTNRKVSRLIHAKTGLISFDQWYWNEAPDSKEIWIREEFIKQHHNWEAARTTYLDKKNMHLRRNDYDIHSFNCFIEAVNEVYYQMKR